MATPTASPDRDPTFEKIMAALPAPIREGLDRVLGMAETEGHAAALGFLQQLMRKNEQATGPDRIPDRLPFALELSLTACAALDRLQAVSSFHPWSRDLGAGTLQLRLTQDDLIHAERRLQAAGADICARSWACPNCGKSGEMRGAALLMGFEKLFYADLYFPIDSLLSGTPNLDVLTHKQRNVVATNILRKGKSGAPVRRCGTCDLYYVDWPNRSEKVSDFYRNEDDGQIEIRGERVYGRTHQLSSAYIKSALPLYLRRVLGPMENRTVLDIGCAEGSMMAAFRMMGATVAGVDLETPKVGYARHVLDLEAAETDPTAITERFDVIVCFHTLEHILTVDDALDDMRSKLTPGGVVVISVPDCGPLDGGLIGDLGGDHLIGFDATSLKALLARRGFEIASWITDGRTDPANANPERDPLLGLPIWSARHSDITVVARPI